MGRMARKSMMAKGVKTKRMRPVTGCENRGLAVMAHRPY